MRVWLITVGEPLPVDQTGDRPYRTGLLARFLTAGGHDVTWWSSTLDHIRKRQRAAQSVGLDVEPGLKLILLHGKPYRRNVSIARVRNHVDIAREFERLAPAEPRPDIILCSLPTLELADAATEFGQARAIPVVLDVRDLWPDIFVDLLPFVPAVLMRQLLRPMFGIARRACARATAITGVSPGFVRWGIRNTGRHATPLDRAFAMGYSSTPPDAAARATAGERWSRLGLGDGLLNVCYFGTMARQFELDTVILAARRLEEERCAIRFILCGDGESRGKYEKLAAGLRSVVFPGWINQAEIWTLMRQCRLALAPYIDSPNYAENLPNKPIEYLSAGLPIVSSMRGYLERLLAENRIGVTYRNGDAQALARSLSQLSRDPVALDAMSKNARELYEREFRAETVYPNLVHYLEEIARQRAGAVRRGTARSPACLEERSG